MISVTIFERKIFFLLPYILNSTNKSENNTVRMRTNKNTILFARTQVAF